MAGSLDKDAAVDLGVFVQSPCCQALELLTHGQWVLLALLVIPMGAPVRVEPVRARNRNARLTFLSLSCCGHNKRVFLTKAPWGNSVFSMGRKAMKISK